jgi:hypothetical protein
MGNTLSNPQAEIVRLRGVLERARNVLEQAEFALNNCGFQSREDCLTEHEEALGAVRALQCKISAALKKGG